MERSDIVNELLVRVSEVLADTTEYQELTKRLHSKFPIDPGSDYPDQYWLEFNLEYDKIFTSYMIDMIALHNMNK